MVLVVGALAVSEEVIRARLAIVGEIKNVEHVMLLLLDHLPAEVHNRLQTDGLMVLFPAMAY